MTSPLHSPLRRARLASFTAFDALEVEFCDGLNLFVGENATGKTHLLKFLYAAVRAEEEAALGAPPAEGATLGAVSPSEKLKAVFRPAEASLGRLVRKGAVAAEVLVEAGAVSNRWAFDGEAPTHHRTWNRMGVHSAVFIPSREALAMFEGFMAAYQRRELSFDETYYDLCLALSASPLRGAYLEQQRPLIERLEQLLGGRVRLEGARFYVERDADEQAIEAHLLAEGHRKLATLVQLLRNGSLRPGSILFWDEPEANLNPQLILTLVEILQELAAAGVQIFLATHDYLLSHRLSLAAEYKTRPDVATRFFSFFRPQPGAGVEVEWADTLAGIEHNPILDGFAALYDLESRLFTRGAGRG